MPGRAEEINKSLSQQRSSTARATASPCDRSAT
jgi:hypothetical protein